MKGTQEDGDREMSMAREERLKTLLALVEDGEYRTQAELVDALASRGYAVTQSSVSRDIRQLGLFKVDGFWTAGEDAWPQDEDGEGQLEIWTLIESVEQAGDHMLVLRCPSAMAQPLAAALDRASLEGLVGTIAGDDTIFCAVRSGEHSLRLRRRLRSWAERSSP